MPCPCKLWRFGQVAGFVKSAKPGWRARGWKPMAQAVARQCASAMSRPPHFERAEKLPEPVGKGIAVGHSQ